MPTSTRATPQFVWSPAKATPTRNNRIASDDFLNRTCAFGGRLESILFRGPPQNPFSTASVKSGKARGEHIPSGLPPRADIVDALCYFRFVPILLQKVVDGLCGG